MVKPEHILQQRTEFSKVVHVGLTKYTPICKCVRIYIGDFERLCVPQSISVCAYVDNGNLNEQPL